MVFYACYAYLCLIIDALWLIMLFTWPYSTIPEQDRGPWRGCLEPDPIFDAGYCESLGAMESRSKTLVEKSCRFFCYGLGRGSRRGRIMPDMTTRGELTRLMGQGQLGHHSPLHLHATYKWIHTACSSKKGFRRSEINPEKRRNLSFLQFHDRKSHTWAPLNND